jgi:large subunit ribosomal protein L7/L12
METTNTTDALAQSISNLTIPQLVELTKRLEKDWGVSAAPQAITPSTTISTEPAKVAQTEFTVVLTSFPADKKIAVIKMLREIMGLGLLEAKQIAESAPKPIRENVSQEEADNVRTRLTEAGGVVEVK